MQYVLYTILLLLLNLKVSSNCACSLLLCAPYLHSSAVSLDSSILPLLHAVMMRLPVYPSLQ